METIEYIFYFIVTLGVLVFVHELGHFLAAKLCGMRVDRFSIGFPPRAFGKVVGETDYCVSWIPIGGYVKIAGMIDESFDTEHLSRPAEPWEYRAKPIWQRMIVISAGVIMNILLAIAIFWGINFSNGRTVRETTQIAYVDAGSAAAASGFMAGDRVLAMNGDPVLSWDDVMTGVYFASMNDDVTVRLLRENTEVSLVIPLGSVPDPTETGFGLTSQHSSVSINQVEPGKPADVMGLRPGDVLVRVDGMPVFSTLQVTKLIGERAGRPVVVEWLRADEPLSGTAVPGEEGKIGIAISSSYDGPSKVLSYSLIEAFPVAVNQVVSVSLSFVNQIWLMIVGDSSFVKNIGGPIKIAQMATQSAELGVTTYLAFMALLSISLAVLNMLPIPALDGGHFLFLLIEGVIRRELPVRLKLMIQQAGMAVLLAFMLFVVLNDIFGF